MGKLKSTNLKPLMTAHEVAQHLLLNCQALLEFESFMFGSSLFGIGSDFDILIVGPSGEPLHRLKHEMNKAGQELPLDILYMLPAEAKATNFVENQGCIPLIQLSRRES
jgi:hypothetical protein